MRCHASLVATSCFDNHQPKKFIVITNILCLLQIIVIILINSEATWYWVQFGLLRILFCFFEYCRSFESHFLDVFLYFHMHTSVWGLCYHFPVSCKFILSTFLYTRNDGNIFHQCLSVCEVLNNEFPAKWSITGYKLIRSYWNQVPSC